MDSTKFTELIQLIGIFANINQIRSTHHTDLVD